ncbi:sigma-54-dependent transcriptional regulator [Desulfovibrio inopinatus]|uniref:sigma-54-dependent transcriptional regulator n=1 Tax=Desulfovibrio inopinatus TaxID=102109 RepID=UPI0004247AAA|nr:sigma-54 dependent transcriptional regulator [Desulfovibrio inopinatus]
MVNRYQVLVVDDELPILKLLQKELTNDLRNIDTAPDAATAREMVKKQQYDIIVLDIRLPDGDGLDLYVEFKGRLADAEFILITGHGAIDNAVEAMRLGVYDYITKPFKLDRLELVIDRAYQRVALQRENRGLKHSQKTARPTQKLIGNSAPIKHIRFLIDKVAPTDVPVLITGDSGAGKDVVANSIHAASNRNDAPLIVKNCATLQRELARSELFGHTKGSFTGATENREGLMTFAHKGTLFLDEIGELPLEVQASLLRALESKSYRRVGEKDERTADIRFLFATNRNLGREVEEGRFHEALFHRINVFNIEIPSLYQRKEDVPLLVEHFLGRLCRTLPSCTITDKAMQCLLNYNWPGNVRELRNVIERSIILADNGIITDRALPKELVEQAFMDSENDSFLSIDAMERDHIGKVLSFYDGNRAQAAKALGIGRKTLYRKIQKYGISVD